MISQIIDNKQQIANKYCNDSYHSYYQILTIFCTLHSCFFLLHSPPMHLLISTESHPDHTIQRLTGVMPSSAVAMIDIHKKKWVLYLDSRYASRQIAPRLWRTFTKKRRTSWWDFLSQDEEYQISPLCSIATEQALTAAWLTIQISDADWWSKQRIVKSSDELEYLKICYSKSLQVLAFIQNQIDGWVLIGKSCLQLRGECIAYAMSLWLTDEAFSMIVATGKQTASPHHETDASLIDEWALLIDMGWKYWWYCSDMTRCRWIGTTKGEEYSEWKKIYDSVQLAKDTCVNNVKLWMTWKEVDGLARSVIKEVWYGEYFTHSTGHGIGLEVHEQPWISSSKVWENKVEEWMYLTIEPGIYLPWKFGVRLEDSYVMKEYWLYVL